MKAYKGDNLWLARSAEGKVCCILGVLLVFSVGLYGAAAAQEPTDESAPPISAGCEDDYAPFSFVNEAGEADGFAVELMRAAAEAMGREVTYRTESWREIKEDLAEGQIEALPLAGRTPEREEVFDFTFPYLTLHGTIVVREDNTEIRNEEDLYGKRVAVLQEDNAHEYLRRSGLAAEAVPLGSFTEALVGLSEGRYDAVVIQKLLAFHIMRKYGLDNLRAVGGPLEDFTQSFCFAVQEGDDQLLSLLNEGLSIVMANGTFRQLYTKWFATLETLERTKSRIVVGGETHYPPYEFLDENGQPVGYNVDLTQAIARQMGLAVDVRLAPWSEVREGLARGEIDVLQGMFYSAGRDKQFSFSPAHAVVQQVIVVRDDSPPLRTMEDLAGRTILVTRGDILHDLAVERGYGDHVVAFDTQEEVLRRLAAGEGDCALAAELPTLYWIREIGLKNLKIAGPPVLSAEYCYAVRHGNEHLLSVFTEGLAAVQQTGEYRAIRGKWLAPLEEPAVDFGTVMRYVGLAAAPLLILLGAAFLWLRLLRSQVRQRTADLRAANVSLRQSEERLARSQEIAHLGSWELDLATNTLTWSDEVYRLFGLRPQEFKATYEAFLAGVHPEDRAAVDAAYQDSIREKQDAYEIEHRVVRKNTGEVRWVHEKGQHEWSAAGEIIRSVGMVLDITERKRAEDGLKQLNETLEQRVAERTEQLRALALQLSQAEQQERKRLAKILHDHLQQLIVAARMQLGWLKRGEDLEAMRSAAEDVSDILQEAVDASRSLAVDLSPPVLHEAGLIGGLNWLAGHMEKKHQFRVEVQAEKTAEPRHEALRIQLFESVRELLLNAVKHSGVSRAKADLMRTDEGQIKLVISDEGKGFDPNVLKRRRADEVSFGLFSIQERLAPIGGQMTVESAPGQGTRITMTIPDGEPAEEAEETAPAAAAREPEETVTIRHKSDLCRVLIVDDHKIMREGLAKLFRLQSDIEVVGEAADGPEAIELAEALRPDVVIMDVNLGEMSGVEATRRILEQHPEIKVIGLSMHLDKDVADAMLVAGACAYLTKSGPSEELIATVRRQANVA